MMVIHILVIDKLRNERYNRLINGILMNAYQMLRFFFLVFCQKSVRIILDQIENAIYHLSESHLFIINNY